MGSCLSKKSILSSSSSSSSNQEITKSNTLLVEKKKLVEGHIVRKEIFVIKHRISHEGGGSKDEKGHFKNANEVAKNANFSGDLAKNANFSAKDANFSGKSAPMRTTSSSCSKEEIDAILIQCGRFSRSSSTSRSRKCSSSKKSFDFDYENTSDGGKENDADHEDDAVAGSRAHRHRQRERHLSQGRRKTLSQERDETQQQERQSGSRERCSSEGVRRVSISPGRRSESPRTVSNTNANGMIVKMVSVPATVSSVMVDKSNDAGNAELISTAAIQRIQVKRNVGAASPRARSPARMSAKVSNENKSLSRSNSRRKEGSPFRRNPLSEIESMSFYTQKLNAEKLSNGEVMEQQQLEDKAKALRTVPGNAAVDVLASGLNNHVPTGMRRRLSRLSRDLDIDLMVAGNAAVEVVDSGLDSYVPPQETRSNRPLRLSRDLDVNLGVVSTPTQSYTDLLLQDIQNFHQKNNNTAFSLPACVTKAHSIVDAVYDLNSSTSSSLSSAFSEDRKRITMVEHINKNADISQVANTFGRGTDGGLESAGSNTTVGGQQLSSPLNLREPNSADSTNSWAASKSYSRLHFNPLAFQKHTMYESGLNMDEGKRRETTNTTDSENQQRGIGRYSVVPRGLHTSMAPAAASTYLI